MLRALFSTVYSFWVRVANIGVGAGLTFHETKKTQLLNIVVASGIPLNLFFCVLNFYQGKTLLSVINFFLLGGAVLILVINSYRRFLLSRLIMTFLASILFMMGAIFFRNGGEYYLITNLIVIIIYFNERIYIFLISLFNCVLFVAAKIYLEYPGYDYDYGRVPFPRVIFNISWALLIIVLALLFFKKEQEDYQEVIEQKNQELEALNDTKQKLFSIIAHDLRSPIGQLKNSLELVSNEYISPEMFKQISAKLSSEVDQLHNTLDNLLNWSISQFNGINVSPQANSLTAMMERKARFFKPVLEKKNLALSWELSHLSVYADPDHLLLVLRNLISNAIKYSYENGHIYVRARKENNEVIISVSDTGTGMNEQRKQTLLRNDHLQSVTGTSKEKGTGLGLKLCKEFIEKNNGRIWIESAEGKGSTFYVALPIA